MAVMRTFAGGMALEAGAAAARLTRPRNSRSRAPSSPPYNANSAAYSPAAKVRTRTARLPSMDSATASTVEKSSVAVSML